MLPEGVSTVFFKALSYFEFFVHARWQCAEGLVCCSSGEKQSADTVHRPLHLSQPADHGTGFRHRSRVSPWTLPAVALSQAQSC